MQSLELFSVSKSYGIEQALKSLDISFKPGIYGILGENGAGKSTLMNILTDNVSKTSGKICLDGQEVSGQKEYRSKLGYMPQQAGCYASFSVGMFLNYIGECKGISKKECNSQIDELLNKVNLVSKKHCRMDALSGGMKQRVLLAQALLGNPEILILDEPTAGLDPKERIHIRNLILELSKDKCILLATHVVSDIESIADYIIISGEIIAKGTPKQLISNVFGKVFELKCTKEEIKELLIQYPNANIVQTQQGIAFRIACENKPDNAEIIQDRINLEDVYLYYFR